MKKRTLFSLILASVFFSLTSAYAQSASVVNFSTCITDSKYGKREQEAFEDVRNKITSITTDLEGQLSKIANQLQDPEFVDSLSPEAEQEMKARFQSLSEDLSRYQNQYYQVMNQANMKLVQLMSSYVSQASESIAKKQDYSIVLNKEACFYYKPKEDITAAVIVEMDKNFDREMQPSTTPAAAAATSEKPLNSGRE